MRTEWDENYTREDLRALCNVLVEQNARLIRDNMFFQQEFGTVVDAARRAFPLRHTDNGAGLRQLIRGVRLMKERCEARAIAAQMKRSQKAMEEIATFRASATVGKLP